MVLIIVYVALYVLFLMVAVGRELSKDVIHTSNPSDFAGCDDYEYYIRED